MASGTVKLYNSLRGFGFILPDDGSPDVFVHVSAIERSGVQELRENDRVTFEVEEDRRSGKLAAVELRVTASGSPSPSRPDQRSQSGFRPHGVAPRPLNGGRKIGGREVEGSGSGIVKWFNATKGFGFIQPNYGGEDLFVHISALERAGLRDLREGQAVSYEIERDGRSGRATATNLRLGA